MKPILILLMAMPLAAQDPTPPAAPPAAAAPAASPTPSSENWITGYAELGYRGLTGVGGSMPTYRSIVDLGSGLKLTDTDFTVIDPKHRLFDRIRVRADHWGDDPWSSFHLFAEKRELYKLLIDIRRLSYFNNLPAYADPTLSGNVGLDQQSFDTRRYTGTYRLELFDNHTFSPYLEFEHNASAGTGVTTFSTGSDVFAVPDTTSDSTELYRAGTHISGHNYHLSFEAGGSTYKSSQNTYTYTSAAPNPGDLTAPVFGTTQGLTSLLDAYGVRGSSVFTTAAFSFSPFTWVDLYGNFLYSEPQNTLNYQQYNSGSFFLESELLAYTSEQYLIASQAKLPHSSGNAGAEIRPLKRLRLLEAWSTDHLHDAGAATQKDTLLAATSSTTVAEALGSALGSNYSQAETSAILTLTPHLTVRGGYRHIWGNASDYITPAAGLPGVIAETLRRNVGFGAATYRAGSKLSLTLEFEKGVSTGAYFRTSLYDYKKLRTMARFQLLKTLHASADYSVLSNSNPSAGARYLYFSHQETLGLDWAPKGDRLTLDASWSHCSYHSEINYLAPDTLTPVLSDYYDDCHSISAYLATHFALGKSHIVQLSAGGAAVLTTGSMPTTFYQPAGRLSVPITKQVGFFSEWRYYGFGESYYGYESFRAHLITIGLRYTR